MQHPVLRGATLALLVSLSLVGQTNRGGISGTISDQSQSVVPNATVTVTNVGTNEVRTATTAMNGTYSIMNLEPVTYQVKIEAPGFKTAVIQDVKVDTAAIATLSMTLQAGSVDTRITVEANATMVDTQSGTASNTISARQIQDVPLLNRSVLDLALTLPNVGGDAGSEDPVIVSVTPCPGCNLTLGGGRPMSTNILADGASNTGVSLGRTIVSFTPETVQEFTVQTSAFSAEYGKTGGGIINVTTKSGTNMLTGTALWFNRSPNLAAAPFTLASTNRPVPTLKYNQFSLAAGGPVWIPKVYNGKNKTFWFAAVEPQYRRDHLDQYGLMPTDGMRDGNFSGLVNTNSGWLPQSVVDQFRTSAPNAVAIPANGGSAIYNQFNVINGTQFQQATLAAGASYAPFPNNTIPQSMLDKTAIKTLPMIASAGPYYLNSNGLISNIFSPRLLSQDVQRFTVRIDHNLTDNNRIYGRYSTTPIVKIQGTPVSPTNNASIYSWGTQALIADTHTFSPTVLNELRLNYTRGRFSNTLDPRWDTKTGANLNTELGLPSITTGGLPTFSGLFPGSSLGGGGSTATGFGGAGSTNVDDREERYGLTDIVYKTHGSMSLKFGFDFNHALQNVIPLYGAFGGIYPFAATQTNSTGTSTGVGGATWASYLLGVPSGNITMRNVVVPYYYRWNDYAAFIQNDWKVKPNLTLNLGLRYALEMPRTEKYNNQGVFRADLAQTTTLPTPLKLADGTTLTQTMTIPFAFSGLGGNSKYQTTPQYRDFEPRFGFAWQPKALSKYHLVVRGGYGLSHAPIGGFTQLPQPDFGATSTFSPVGSATASSSTANPSYYMRLGENPPVLSSISPATQVFGPQGPPSNGLSFANSLYYQQAFGGYAVSQNYHTPYVNNWNFTISWQASNNTTFDFAYQGAMGIHLFMGPENINPKNSSLISAQLAQNTSTTATINDPLGRLNPITNRVLTVQNGTLGSPFLGYSSLYLWYDAAGNSIRHASYVNMTHRAGRGLTLTTNYTYGKSIDTASSAGGDKNVLTSIGGQTQGQVPFGGTRANDRSVSSYDQRHLFHANAIYDMPFGTGRKYASHVWKPLDFVIGGWTVSGLTRISSGFPYMVYLSDTNQLGDLTHSVRPDIVSGVPLINPNFNRSCPTGTGCQPYLNPSAFARPALGALGTAPRTLDGVRGPWQPFFDTSLQKSFRLHGEKYRLQFRVDALNVFNHPVFAVYPNNGGGADFMGAPNAATSMTQATYDTWAAFNNLPTSKTDAAAAAAGLASVNNMLTSQLNASKVLPAGFFNVPLATNFWGTSANGFDIRTASGYKQYQLRQAYGTNFGTLYNNSSPRYVQLGIKLYF